MNLDMHVSRSIVRIWLFFFFYGGGIAVFGGQYAVLRKNMWSKIKDAKQTRRKVEGLQVNLSFPFLMRKDDNVYWAWSQICSGPVACNHARGHVGLRLNYWYQLTQSGPFHHRRLRIRLRRRRRHCRRRRLQSPPELPLYWSKGK